MEKTKKFLDSLWGKDVYILSWFGLDAKIKKEKITNVVHRKNQIRIGTGEYKDSYYILGENAFLTRKEAVKGIIDKLLIQRKGYIQSIKEVDEKINKLTLDNKKYNE